MAKIVLNEDQKSLMKELYFKFKDIGRVAESLGFSYSFIRSKLHENNIPVANKGAKLGNKHSLGYKQSEEHKSKKNKYLDHSSESQSKRTTNRNKLYWKVPSYRSKMIEQSRTIANSKFGFKERLKDPIYYDKHCRQSMINATSRKSIKYLSNKSGIIYLKSKWELLVAEFLDNNPEVVSFVYEPLSISYKDKEGKNRKYYPDFLVSYNYRKELLEIKPSFLLSEDINVRKLKAAKEYCISENLIFKVVTEKELTNYNKV